MKRYALVSLKGTSGEQIARYLPANYEKTAFVPHANAIDDSDYEGCYGPCVLIEGEDVAGWTLDGYVLPRLGSGMIVGREIDLSHPIMKQIPEGTTEQLADGPETVTLAGGTYNFIVAYEAGELESQEEFIDGFADLIRTGLAWNLQGHYGREANRLIEAGYISPQGDVLDYDLDS